MDVDGDGEIGPDDVCVLIDDADNDFTLNADGSGLVSDTGPETANLAQLDLDGDGLGDEGCDPDPATAWRRLRTARRSAPAWSATRPAPAASEPNWTTDRAGNARRLETTVWWKRAPGLRTQLVTRVDAPASERGTAFLLVEDSRGTNLWSYLPELRTVRRVTGRAASGSFLASDFTYEDIARLDGEAPEARIEQLPDTEPEGRPALVFEGRPAPESGSPHHRIVTFVDRETCVVLRADLEGPTGARSGNSSASRGPT